MQAHQSLEDEYAALSREYQDYAYIVSHDMNASLRHVREFTGLLLSERGASVNDQEKEYEKFINRALDKLEHMQRALLDFSRLNTRANPHQYVDLEQIYKNALQKLDARISEKNTTIKACQWPEIKGDPAQLAILFYNILENALKFSTPDRLPEIKIEAREDAGVWEFEITDNGIGIEGGFEEEVFRLFRRLEPEKYEGIGAGLTIARKIARLHGGDIRIKKTQAQGACIVVTLASN